MLIKAKREKTYWKINFLFCSWIQIRISKPDLDPDPGGESNADPCGSGSATLTNLYKGVIYLRQRQLFSLWNPYCDFYYHLNTHLNVEYLERHICYPITLVQHQMLQSRIASGKCLHSPVHDA
jgi:hypothetical protein